MTTWQQEQDFQTLVKLAHHQRTVESERDVAENAKNREHYTQNWNLTIELIGDRLEQEARCHKAQISESSCNTKAPFVSGRKKKASSTQAA